MSGVAPRTAETEHRNKVRAGTEHPVICTDSPTLFERIHQPGTELVIWERKIPDVLRQWLQRLSPQQFPNTRFLLEAGELEAALAAAFKESNTPRGAASDLLIADICYLARIFGTVLRSELIDVRVEVIAGRGCWKFHRDCVPARMLTTYRGAPTQWVTPDHSEAAIAEQRQYSGEMCELGTNAVALFKGSTSIEGAGIVHRSPPASSRKPRFFVCFNLPSRASPERWHQ